MSPQVIILFLEPEKTRIPMNFCPSPETRMPANLLPGPVSGLAGPRTRPRGGPNTVMNHWFRVLRHHLTYSIEVLIVASVDHHCWSCSTLRTQIRGHCVLDDLGWFVQSWNGSNTSLKMFATLVGWSICTWVQVLNHFRFQLLPLIGGQCVWVFTLSLGIFDKLVVHHILGHLNAENWYSDVSNQQFCYWLFTDKSLTS